MCDDDFHFDFDDEGPCIDEPLHIIADGDEMFVGHIVEDFKGVAWMLRPYSIIECEDESVVLIEVPRIRVDDLLEVIFVTNADEMRMLHSTSALSIGYINDIPFVCNSTRH